jgi:hypothetical protein
MLPISSSCSTEKVDGQSAGVPVWADAEAGSASAAAARRAAVASVSGRAWGRMGSEANGRADVGQATVGQAGRADVGQVRAGLRRACGRAPPGYPAIAAPGPGSTGIAPGGGSAPGANSASTEPPNPPPMIRAPSAPASLQAFTASSTAGTETS